MVRMRYSSNIHQCQREKQPVKLPGDLTLPFQLVMKGNRLDKPTVTLFILLNAFSFLLRFCFSY